PVEKKTTKAEAEKVSVKKETAPKISKTAAVKTVEAEMPLSESSVAKPSRGSLKTKVFGIDGKDIGEVSLPSEVFAAKVNPVLMAQAVRVYLANQRQGTASTKTRGE